MAESREEAMEVLNDISNNNEVKIDAVKNEGYSQQIVYEYFDGVADVEQEYLENQKISHVDVGVLLRTGVDIRVTLIIVRKCELKQTKKPLIYCLIIVLEVNIQYTF